MSSSYRHNPRQTGTGGARSSDPPTEQPNTETPPVDPAIVIGATGSANNDRDQLEPNRSGSGGSGGSRAEGPDSEGSTGQTNEELLQQEPPGTSRT
jgi:hypothetical protein